jgi:type III pantothenate kinase
MVGRYGMKILLADIGNTYFHIYDGEGVKHLSYDDAISNYATIKMQYISVKSQLDKRIEEIKVWENISSVMKIEGEYDTMGIDRKALCLSRENGLFIDAGSAITVDVVENGTYIGGFILPGLKAYIESYKTISPALETSLSKDLKLEQLPTTTKEQISYGIIASIKALIDKHSEAKTLYFTGGDGKFLSTFFDDAVYDETLVFEGMQKALKMKTIKDNKKC